MWTSLGVVILLTTEVSLVPKREARENGPFLPVAIAAS